MKSKLSFENSNIKRDFDENKNNRNYDLILLTYILLNINFIENLTYLPIFNSNNSNTTYQVIRKTYLVPTNSPIALSLSLITTG